MSAILTVSNRAVCRYRRMKSITELIHGAKPTTNVVALIVVVVCATFTIFVYRYSLYALPPIAHPLGCTVDRSSLSLRQSCYGHSGQMFNATTTIASFQVSLFVNIAQLTIRCISGLS